MRRVLVTGARGFIGRRVTAALSSAQIEIHAVSSKTPDVRGALTWHTADLLDVAQVHRLVSDVRPDALIHLAWSATPPDYWRDPDNVRWTAASLELVRAFAEHGGTRVLGVGTCAEYDWSHGYCVEDFTPLAPATLYGAAKAALGSLLLAYAREKGLSAVWARPFFLFGPGGASTRLIPSLVTQLQASRPARCASGCHVRDFLFVDDAAEALVALFRSEITGAVNIGSGVPTQIGALAAAVATRLGRCELLEIESGPLHNELVVARVARLREELGWQPRVDFETALDITVRWWADRAGVGLLS